MRVYTLSDRRSKKTLRVYTASEAKGLNNFLNMGITKIFEGFIFVKLYYMYV